VRRFLVLTSLRRFNEEPHIHAKILVAALLISNGVRGDAEALFYLTDVDKTVKILGERVKRLFPDEDSSIGYLKKGPIRREATWRRCEEERPRLGIRRPHRPHGQGEVPPLTAVYLRGEAGGVQPRGGVRLRHRAPPLAPPGGCGERKRR
jgi:hypothetical protein